jgi:hypothetical protein
MIHPAPPPPPTRGQLLRELAAPIAAVVLAIAMFIRTAFF